MLTFFELARHYRDRERHVPRLESLFPATEATCIALKNEVRHLERCEVEDPSFGREAKTPGGERHRLSPPACHDQTAGITFQLSP